MLCTKTQARSCVWRGVCIHDCTSMACVTYIYKVRQIQFQTGFPLGHKEWECPSGPEMYIRSEEPAHVLQTCDYYIIQAQMLTLNYIYKYIKCVVPDTTYSNC